MRTDQEILDQTNELARKFAFLMGYETEKTYDFRSSIHPRARLCWKMACMAQEFLTNTDVCDIEVVE